MRNAKMSFFIQGGKYKGKKLYIPTSFTTRSTKSIIRGSVFDVLQQNIIDKIFVEVFAGSGSMGLEALSRGASAAYFIEKDKEAFSILQKNCALIDKKNSHLIFGDSFEAYSSLIKDIKLGSKSAYLYFDPPFDIRKGMEGIYEKVIDLIEKTPPSIVETIIIEHTSGYVFCDRIGDFKKIKNRKFGKTTLSYYIPER